MMKKMKKLMGGHKHFHGLRVGPTDNKGVHGNRVVPTEDVQSSSTLKKAKNPYKKASSSHLLAMIKADLIKHPHKAAARVAKLKLAMAAAIKEEKSKVHDYEAAQDAKDREAFTI